MIDSHRQICLLMTFENADQIHQMTSSFKMRSLYEVSVRKYVAASQMHEMRAFREFLSHFYDIIMSTGRK